MKNIAQIAIGIGLIISGILCEISADTYEVRIYELLTENWLVVPFLTRIIIALQIYLGLSLVFNVNPKRINTYLLLLLSLFVTYDLVWDILFNTNPYYLRIWPVYIYFGAYFAYFKILLAIPLIALSLFLFKKGKSTDFRYKWIKYTFMVAPLAFVFIYVAVFPKELKDLEPEFQTKMNLGEMNNELHPGYQPIEAKEDQFLLFVSTGCPHCFEITRKFAAIQRNYPELEIRLVLFDSTSVSIFQEFANSKFPFSVISAKAFVEVTDRKVPRIIHMKNDKIEKQWDGQTLNYSALNYVQDLQ